MSIYVVTHKFLDNRIKLSGYKYLFVGASKLRMKKEGYLYDDEKENISIKNPNYCELTGLYWIWKNSDDEYKGLVHYRRFFSKNGFFKNIGIYKESELNEILQKKEIIVADKIYMPEKNVYINYYKRHNKNDVDNVEKIIKEEYPDYLPYFKTVFEKRYYNPYNMIYCKREFFDNYCKWLFELFEKLEKITDLSNYNEYQARMYGFLSERLLNVWIEKNNLKKEELKVVQIDGSLKYKIRIIVERVLKKSFSK